MLLFFQGIIELISNLDYLFNATQNEKITDWEPSRGQYFGPLYWLGIYIFRHVSGINKLRKWDKVLRCLKSW